MSEWREVPFPSAVDFREGPGIMARDFRTEGVPLIRLAGLSPGADLLLKANFLDASMVAKKWSHFRVELGDVLLSTSASLGRVATVGPTAVGAVPYTGIIRMRPETDELDASFLPWLLQSPHFAQQVEWMGVGSVMSHFGPSHLRQMTVLLPPLDEQRRIAAVLGAFDDLIDTNRKLIMSIDSQAQAIFARSMLHDGPVDVVTLSQLVERGDLVLSDGYRTRVDQLSVIGIPILRVADVLDAEVSPTYKDHIQESFRAKVGVKLSHVHDVVITTKGTVGRIALVPPGFPEHAYSPQLCFLRAANPDAFCAEWLYRWARSNEFLRQIGLVKDQTDMAPYVSLTDLRCVEMTMPAPSVRRLAEDQLVPLTSATEGLREEIADLTSTRDGLLPLLLSGKVRVSEDLRVA